MQLTSTVTFIFLNNMQHCNLISSHGRIFIYNANVTTVHEPLFHFPLIFSSLSYGYYAM